jgi:hypothetical protein
MQCFSRNVHSSLSRLRDTNRSSTPTRRHLPRLPHLQPLYIAHLSLPSIRPRFSHRHTAIRRPWLPTHLSRHPGTGVVPTFHSSLLRSVLSPTGPLPTRHPILFYILLAWHHEIHDTIIDFYYHDFRTCHIKMGLSAALFVCL